jgi:hypothetical protein
LVLLEPSINFDFSNGPGVTSAGLVIVWAITHPPTFSGSHTGLDCVPRRGWFQASRP